MSSYLYSIYCDKCGYLEESGNNAAVFNEPEEALERRDEHREECKGYSVVELRREGEKAWGRA